MPSDTMLRKVISSIESGNDRHAIRFEPAVFGRISGSNKKIYTAVVNRIRLIHSCSTGTAESIYSTSYGAYQIMGFNLYDPNILNVEYKFYNYLDNIFQSQEDSFNKFLEINSIDFTLSDMMKYEGIMDKFAIKYNGDKNYSTLIRIRAKQLFPGEF